MDKPVTAYQQPELESKVPMLILAPTVVNDGRKLYISSLPVSYMNSEILNLPGYSSPKLSGVDFQGLFKDQGAENLRFLSALRMSATFPYITPNTTLPTNPPVEIMDAGISDNFGLSDAVRFLFAFKDWIGENTSGVVILSVRDSPKLSAINETTGATIFENFQDITNDNLIGYAQSWLKAPIDRVDIQYFPSSYTVPILQDMDSIRQHSARASLSWRLTSREKQGIMEIIHSPKNQEELEKLKKLLQ
jgi:hypothetical protein